MTLVLYTIVDYHGASQFYLMDADDKDLENSASTISIHGSCMKNTYFLNLDVEGPQQFRCIQF